MIAFDQTGSGLWTVLNDAPQIATPDNGVIGQSGTTYDQNGNVTGQISLVTQSWPGYAYQDGPVSQFLSRMVSTAKGFVAVRRSKQLGKWYVGVSAKVPPIVSSCPTFR
jgi:hypothetical protein